MTTESFFAQLKHKFSGYEIPKSVRLVAEDFSVEKGLFTLTLKLKHHKVIKRNTAKIEAAFSTKCPL